MLGFSVPTKEELKKDTVDTYNAGNNKTVQAFNSFLKIPVTGYRHINGTIQASNTIHMWTRSAASNSKAYYAHITKDVKEIKGNFSRILGSTVRCIKDI
jgi:hypothetical protein